MRVSNLSEDTREQDLQELFRPFGPVTRIYVAFNRETGESRGFAFVNFVNKDDAQRAIDKRRVRLRQPHPSRRVGRAAQERK